MKKITLSIVSLSIASAVSAQTNTDQVIGKTLQTPIIKSGIKAPEVVSEKAILWGPNSFSTPSEWSFTDNAASGDNWSAIRRICYRRDYFNYRSRWFCFV
jgi:hypothetical protein